MDWNSLKRKTMDPEIDDDGDMKIEKKIKTDNNQ